jgi:hypothetical protein
MQMQHYEYLEGFRIFHQPNCRFNADKNAPHFCRLTWALGNTNSLAGNSKVPYKQSILPGQKWKFALGLAAVFALLGSNELSHPTLPPFIGRWAFLYQALYDTLGKNGTAYYFFGLAALLAYIAIVVWRKERMQT